MHCRPTFACADDMEVWASAAGSSNSATTLLCKTKAGSDCVFSIDADVKRQLWDGQEFSAN